MDDHRTSSDSGRFAASQPFPSSAVGLGGAEFQPLRLVLVPSAMSIDLTKRDQIVGRHSTADVRLPLPDVSRKHCRIFFADAVWNVLDLDSLNGIFVNGQRTRQAVLHAGDRLRIGSFIFEVCFAAQTPTVIDSSRRNQRRAS